MNPLKPNYLKLPFQDILARLRQAYNHPVRAFFPQESNALEN